MSESPSLAEASGKAEQVATSPMLHGAPVATLSFSTAEPPLIESHDPKRVKVRLPHPLEMLLRIHLMQVGFELSVG